MSQAKPKLPDFRFYFHAGGHALSGEFRRPVSQLIPAQAATFLPTSGGHARSRVENFAADHLASFKLGHTHVSGSRQSDGTYTTSTTTSIEQLNILEVVTADRVVSRLTSEHKPKSAENESGEGHIIALGSQFDNLRIAGYDLNITLRHELFIDNKTFDKLRGKAETDKASGKLAEVRGNAIICSLVDKIETKLPGVDPQSHIISVPHLGQISLAEVLIRPGSVTLTMIRLELGSPDEATATVGESLVNGHPWP